MYKENYIFPAIIEKLGEKDYNVTFADFDYITTYGENLADACTMAEDALKLAIFNLYKDKKEIPEASYIDKVGNNQSLILVEVNLKEVLQEI